MTQMQQTAPRPPPTVVLDTNVVLEAWVFENDDSISLMRAVGTRKLQWLATHEMRDELIHVLDRGLGPRWPASWSTLQERWDSHATARSSEANKAAHWPRCTDKDDQKFIDFALQQQARWLISRDRAVLKLASRCAKLGLTVLTPSRWLDIWVAELNSRV
ncbi:MAG: putative toxin-antitoxin system toxin component, PIN family [Rhizobacter sp.]